MDRKDKMFALVELWRESDLTRKAFAGQHNISMAKFAYWCQKQSDEISKPARQGGFIELVTGSGAVEPKACPVAELEFPGGLRIRVY